MTASPPAEIVAKVAAAEDAVIDMAAMAMSLARQHGIRTREPIAAIFDNRNKRQARRLLLAAAMHLYGLNALAERKILGSLSSIDLAGADDFEAMAEFWEIIEDAARDECRDNRERIGADGK